MTRAALVGSFLFLFAQVGCGEPARHATPGPGPEPPAAPVPVAPTVLAGEQARPAQEPALAIGAASLARPASDGEHLPGTAGAVVRVPGPGGGSPVLTPLEAAQREVATLRKGLLRCFNRCVSCPADVRFRGELRLVFGEGGRVTNAAFAGDGEVPEPFRTCMTREAHAVVVPEAEAGSVLAVPLFLTSQGETNGM